eukprot:PLAT10665.1.p1 GENE.PLAT10665.1~~PLAT10665.1.p1  ORF type:complete len:357 (+),score=162.26 PLAT10665.1:30-1100(+)
MAAEPAAKKIRLLRDFRSVWKRLKKADAPLQCKELVASTDDPRWRACPLEYGTDRAAAAAAPLVARSARMYELEGHPGTLLLRHALAPALQMRLARACLAKYTDAKVARSNVDRDGSLLPAALWSTAVADPKSQHARILNKLRWLTLGYHYDWTARAYFEHRKSPVPSLLTRLGSQLAAVAGLRLTVEAVIVNLYTRSSNMGGHTDELELTADPPVVSVSLGAPAVFVIGGRSKSDDASAILLRPGDVVIMSGASRLAYHGIARVLVAAGGKADEAGAAGETEAVEEKAGEGEGEGEGAEEGPQLPAAEEEAVLRYLATHRVNINMRQVVPDGVSFVDAAAAAVASGGGYGSRKSL